jgi:hypothetical protein
VKFGTTAKGLRYRFSEIVHGESRRLGPDEMDVRCLGYIPGSYDVERQIRSHFRRLSEVMPGARVKCEWFKENRELLRLIASLHPKQYRFRYRFPYPCCGGCGLRFRTYYEAVTHC